MTREEATAVVFMTAFESLSEEEKDRFIMMLLENESTREDIIDVLVASGREVEQDRPLGKLASISLRD